MINDPNDYLEIIIRSLYQKSYIIMESLIIKGILPCLYIIYLIKFMIETKKIEWKFQEKECTYA